MLKNHTLVWITGIRTELLREYNDYPVTKVARAVATGMLRGYAKFSVGSLERRRYLRTLCQCVLSETL